MLLFDVAYLIRISVSSRINSIFSVCGFVICSFTFIISNTVTVEV